MTRHIYLRSEILTTKIRMAEICRVLLVTLLLCLYWMPSDTRGESDITNSPDNDFGPPPALPEVEHAEISDRRRSVTDGQDTIFSLLSTFINSGCTDADELVKGFQTMGYSLGKDHIIRLLELFFQSGCQPGQTVVPEITWTTKSNFTDGEKYINKLLTTYISSGCMAATDAIETGGTMRYSSRERSIIGLLKNFFHSGCKPGSRNSGTLIPPPSVTHQGAGFTDGENYIIRQLTAYMSFGCKGAVETVGTGGYIRSDPPKTHIIKLISSYFQSGCKAGFVMTTPKPAPDPDDQSGKRPDKGVNSRMNENPPLEYSAGDIYIINLLTNYTSSGCEGARKITGTGAAIEYSPGENFAIKLMSSFVKKDCKPMIGKAVDDGSSGDAGRHVQSVVLELFLLILGVCLTRIEL